MEQQQCQCLTKKGKGPQCKRSAQGGQKFCHQHRTTCAQEVDQLLPVDPQPKMPEKPYGKVCVASMNLRGKRAPKPDPNCLTLNVTSAQPTNSQERHDLSPMSAVTGGYKGYYCFENYWQSGKVLEGIPHEVSQEWWRSLKEPKRKYPKGKGHQVLHAIYDRQQLNYIESRKQVYVPEYYQLIQGTISLQKWTKIVSNGKCVVVYDFDGPRDQAGEPLCLEVTKELLISKINDSTHPFGHGYVVAGALLGMTPDNYI